MSSFRAAETRPTAPFGLVLSDPNKQLPVSLALVTAAFPILLIAIFAAVRIWVVIPVYSWLYILNVLSFLTPCILYYAFLRNSTMSMLTVGILSLLLFILYVIHIIRVYSFVTGCHQFIQDCNVDGSRVVNAVAAPRYACADYNVQDYLNFTYWASTSTATYWSYGVLFGLVVILSLMASVIALVYTVRLRSGILVTREAPVTYAYTINTNGVTMARGTQPDADNVAVGIPVDKP